MSMGARGFWSIVLMLLLALAVSGRIDGYATTHADGLFTKALTTYAVARTFNGVISVAQGTEIAVQPVGVGLTISAGEILDPLNDLIERFSLLVLAACASLGVQLLLTEMFGNFWVSALLAVAVGGGLLALWQPQIAIRGMLLKLCAAALLLRFLVATVTLLGALLSDAFLSERQDQALADINQVSASLRSADPTSANGPVQAPDADGAAEAETGVLDRINDFFSGQQRSFDIQARLDRMQAQAETATAALVNLIVIFVVQTIVLPIGLLWTALALFRFGWRSTPVALASSR